MVHIDFLLHFYVTISITLNEKYTIEDSNRISHIMIIIKLKQLYYTVRVLHRVATN